MAEGETLAVTGQTEVKLKVVCGKAVRKALKKKGKRKVRLEVTCLPTGNAPLTQGRTVKLLKMLKHHKRHRHKHGK